MGIKLVFISPALIHIAFNFWPIDVKRLCPIFFPRLTDIYELLQDKGSNIKPNTNEIFDPSLCWRVKTRKLSFNYLSIYLSYPYFQAVLFTCMRCPLDRRVEYRAICRNQFWKQCDLVSRFMDFILQLLDYNPGYAAFMHNWNHYKNSYI